MEVKSLLNKVEITERDLGNPPKQKEPTVNWIIKLCTDVVNSPVMVWLLGTILAVVCTIVAIGLKWGCGLLAVWLIVSMVAYHGKRNRWFD